MSFSVDAWQLPIITPPVVPTMTPVVLAVEQIVPAIIFAPAYMAAAYRVTSIPPTPRLHMPPVSGGDVTLNNTQRVERTQIDKWTPCIVAPTWRSPA